MKKQLSEILKEALADKEIYIYEIHYNEHRPHDFVRQLGIDSHRAKRQEPFDKVIAKIIDVEIKDSIYEGDSITLHLECNGETCQATVDTLLESIEYVHE